MNQLMEKSKNQILNGLVWQSNASDINDFNFDEKNILNEIEELERNHKNFEIDRSSAIKHKILHDPKNNKKPEKGKYNENKNFFEPIIAYKIKNHPLKRKNNYRENLIKKYHEDLTKLIVELPS